MTGQGLIAKEGSIRPNNDRCPMNTCLVKIAWIGARLYMAGLEEIADRTRTAQHRLAAGVMRNARLRVVVRLAVIPAAVGLMARRMHQKVDRMYPKDRNKHRCKGEDTGCRDCAARLHLLSADATERRKQNLQTNY